MPLITETSAYLRDKLFQPIAVEYFHKREENCNFNPNKLQFYNISILPKEEIKSSFPPSIILTDLHKGKQSLVSKTTDVISLSNQLFAGSRPLDDEALEILNFTFKRLLKRNPTIL